MLTIREQIKQDEEQSKKIHLEYLKVKIEMTDALCKLSRKQKETEEYKKVQKEELER